ncbi:MAG: hypothetical protein IPK26_20415 [Planctomycetes bacterium]|nr:hypothetical protein [Planctomycetota bacterium]
MGPVPSFHGTAFVFRDHCEGGWDLSAVLCFRGGRPWAPDGRSSVAECHWGARIERILGVAGSAVVVVRAAPRGAGIQDVRRILERLFALGGAADSPLGVEPWESHLKMLAKRSGDQKELDAWRLLSELDPSPRSFLDNKQDLPNSYRQFRKLVDYFDEIAVHEQCLYKGVPWPLRRQSSQSVGETVDAWTLLYFCERFLDDPVVADSLVRAGELLDRVRDCPAEGAARLAAARRDGLSDPRPFHVLALEPELRRWICRQFTPLPGERGFYTEGFPPVLSALWGLVMLADLEKCDIGQDPAGKVIVDLVHGNELFLNLLGGGHCGDGNHVWQKVAAGLEAVRRMRPVAPKDPAGAFVLTATPLRREQSYFALAPGICAVDLTGCFDPVTAVSWLSAERRIVGLADAA